MKVNDKPIVICNSQNPKASVIWLHGLGADGFDFVPVVEMLNMPDVRFILPHAPSQKITLNNGYEMRAWYDLYGLSADSQQDETGINATKLMINGLIEQEVDSGINSQKIILAGFSQGGAMALHTALRYESTLAGVLALSAYLPLKGKLKSEKSVANSATPIFMAHGRQDSVISLATAELSLAVLEAEGYQVNWQEYNMSHTVSAKEISDIKTFLMEIIG